MKEFTSVRGIYYRTNEFKVGRKTLVFIHGLSGNCSAWEPYEERFGDDYNILTFDLRGHGLSKKYPRLADYSMSFLVGDVEDLLKSLQIEEFILVSHSFGTIIALELILRMQKRVTAAVFMAPVFEARHTLGNSFASFISKTLALIADALPCRSTKPGGRIDYGPFLPTGDWSPRRVIADIHNTHLRVYLFCLSQIYEFNRAGGGKGELAALDMPVLIIHGEKDTFVSPERSKKSAAEILKARLVLVPEGNHIAVMNDSKKLCDIMAHFLFSVPEKMILKK
jgi:3-oxoadipate enol-lactonase